VLQWVKSPSTAFLFKKTKEGAMETSLHARNMQVQLGLFEHLDLPSLAKDGPPEQHCCAKLQHGDLSLEAFKHIQSL